MCRTYGSLFCVAIFNGLKSVATILTEATPLQIACCPIIELNLVNKMFFVVAKA